MTSRMIPVIKSDNKKIVRKNAERITTCNKNKISEKNITTTVVLLKDMNRNHMLIQ